MVAGFHSLFACLILSVLTTWIPFIGHGRQTCITRVQAFTTMISFHIVVSCKNGLFSPNVHITVYNQITQKDYPHFCPQTPSHTMQCHNQENQSCAGLWTTQRHKSHLGLLQSKMLFATSYQMVVKRVLTCLLNG